MHGGATEWGGKETRLRSALKADEGQKDREQRGSRAGFKSKQWANAKK